MAKSHKTCMEQAEIIDMFATYQLGGAPSHLFIDGREGGHLGGGGSPRGGALGFPSPCGRPRVWQGGGSFLP